MLLHLVEFAALGALFGFAGGFFGLGGGSIAIPVLGLGFGMTEQVAQGTALVMVVPNVAAGLRRYVHYAQLDLRVAAALAVGSMPATFAGARVATLIPSPVLRVGFAAFSLLIAFDLLRRTFLAQQRPRAAARWPWAILLGAFGGFVSGLFSVGGAVAIIPGLIGFFGCTQLAAQGLSLAFAFPSTLIGTVGYALAGDVDWGVGIPLALGGIPAVRFGVDLARRLPERALRLAFVGYLMAVAVALYVRARGG